jgi:hypothetical protein
MKRLVDAGLIGAQCAAALQHQRDAITPIGPPAAHGGSIRVRRSRIHGEACGFRL